MSSPAAGNPTLLHRRFSVPACCAQSWRSRSNHSRPPEPYSRSCLRRLSERLRARRCRPTDVRWRSEHAAEVELPFLQVRQPQLKFVPIALGTHQFEALEELGEAIADVIAAQNNPVLIVASSDMNHYESDAVTRVKDHKAIGPILALDARALYDAVTQQNISMCGLGPAVVMLTAAKKLGATSAGLVKYATSGDVSGDRDLVVGYAGVVVR